ncbi:YetF domain-containing protein [Evansella halocellulosilytica]|uniref:YetF domain-containing protein n=1 Tax=Evansella halocellulosilytica TaxID=2011013 RepID=UPI000BB9BBC2|nr:DUF421 domain-containing protein [Evansella halocellulosilytica]
MDSELLQVLIRAITAYLILLFVNTMLGKQTLSQMSNHDFITAVMMGAISANLAFDTEINYIYTLTALLVVGMIGYLTATLSLRIRNIRKWVSGSPTVFVEGGKILEENMRKQKYNMDSFNQALREKSIFDIEQVDYAVLEPDGHLSVLVKEHLLPVTKGDLFGKSSEKNRFPVELIIDGEVIENNLKENKLTEEWLLKQIHDHNLSRSEVFYAVLGTKGQLYIDVKNDHIISPVDKEGNE